MLLEEFKDYKFYVSVGYVVLIASILTIILMGIYKLILKKKKIIFEGMDADKKDSLLSKSGRIIALIIYSIVYIINELVLHNEIILNETLIVGLISGGAITLTVAKGLYTSLHQNQKKKKVFDKLFQAETELNKLQKEILSEKQKIIFTKKEKNL